MSDQNPKIPVSDPLNPAKDVATSIESLTDTLAILNGPPGSRKRRASDGELRKSTASPFGVDKEELDISPFKKRSKTWPTIEQFARNEWETVQAAQALLQLQQTTSNESKSTEQCTNTSSIVKVEPDDDNGSVTSVSDNVPIATTTPNREFKCMINPNSYGCNTGQWKKSESRKAISDIFGRNKSQTQDIEDCCILFCRKHYQRASYEPNWQKRKCQLVIQQLDLIENAHPGTVYDIELRKNEKNEVLEFWKKDGEQKADQENLKTTARPKADKATEDMRDDAAKDKKSLGTNVTAGNKGRHGLDLDFKSQEKKKVPEDGVPPSKQKSRHDPTPLKVLLTLSRRCGKNKSVKDVYRVVDIIDEYFKHGKITLFPGIEFVPKVPGTTSTPKNTKSKATRKSTSSVPHGNKKN
ncbi:hypothetical protein M501DRAFT_1030330 [Patellaria atrata CBS 101060]|uniref:Uncharacterized protein n=1 Tax=Patellaria atrata CBS 101060 TaxID=1346257 RepID=A0A9P4SCH7_9PEZI|nr:hypothetical protein M501DRAFT_1030330 [Patellaria atrata CBS 101060]